MSFKKNNDINSRKEKVMTFDIDTLKKQMYPIVGTIYAVHSELGPGLNEYVYQEGFELQLLQKWLKILLFKTI